ncbi:hypothetical protein Pla110_21460 [Polystyrenella longa]|uniref:Uncharacterized protein n=1 Tax=Polystyrenella longa TaxID=2528007 RepID=A0A518CMH2_9PLAN|nr:hypothetical protein [Polystyrenella longa]QDU80417.1 hypothetical protein Pla110_21460 [Polystyrenella longa]
MHHQCILAELSSRIQKLFVMLVTSGWASKQEDELVHQAGQVLTEELKREITGSRTTTKEQKTFTDLGRSIIEGLYVPISNVEPQPILMNYENR